jgi:hypothetical protein
LSIHAAQFGLSPSFKFGPQRWIDPQQERFPVGH